MCNIKINQYMRVRACAFFECSKDQHRHYLPLNERGELGALCALGRLEARALFGERSQHALFARDGGARGTQRLGLGGDGAVLERVCEREVGDEIGELERVGEQALQVGYAAKRREWWKQARARAEMGG
jgi:hypothetical protein